MSDARPLLALLRRPLGPAPLAPDLEAWAAALAAAGAPAPLLDALPAEPWPARFLLLHLGAFPGEALAQAGLRAAAPRLVPLGLSLAAARALLPEHPFAAVVEEEALLRWQEGRPLADAASAGLIGRREGLAAFGTSFTLPPGGYAMARAGSLALPDLLLAYLRGLPAEV